MKPGSIRSRKRALISRTHKGEGVGGFLADDLPDGGEAGRVLRVRGDGGAGQRHAGQP